MARTTSAGSQMLRRLLGWPLLALLAVTACALGFAGFSDRLGQESSILDLGYLTLQLFVVESGAAAGPEVPWTLDVARFLAPATTALALGRALLAIFRDEIEQVRLRRRRDHVVVVGLGRLGLAFVERLCESGQRVSAVARGPAEAVAAARTLGVPVVIGDARDPEVLRRARLDRARSLVLFAGGDGANAEIALTASRLATEAGHPLDCIAHIRDPDLCLLLRREEMSTARPAGFRLEFVNVAERAARLLIDAHREILTGAGVRIGVIGLGDVAEALVAETVRSRLLSGTGSEGLLEIVVVGEGASAVVRRILLRHPSLDGVAGLRLHDAAPTPLPSEAVEDLTGADLIVVCPGDDAAAITAALDVAGRVSAVPLAVALDGSAGLADALTGNVLGPAERRRVHPFLVFDAVLDPDGLLRGTREMLARAIHEHYLTQRQAGSGDPAAVPWADLPESLQASNRAQAGHLGVKLASIGAALAPLTRWDATGGVFGDDEVESLARLEHERFVAERLAAGWRAGPERDVTARTSPRLVAWEDLDEEGRALARDAIRAIPDTLARAGFQIVRSS